MTSNKHQAIFNARPLGPVLAMTLAVAGICYAHAQPSGTPNLPNAADVPSGDAGRFYLDGAASELDAISPSSFSARFTVGVNPRAGLRNDCGSMDFFQNFQAELERLQKKLEQTVKEAQKKIMAAVSGQISSFFQYALMKINPTLGQLTTKQLDEYIELFDLNVKECKDYERDVANGKNPFGEIMQVAVAERWKVSVGMVNKGLVSLETIEEEIIDEARKNGVTMPDGKAYGGEGQDPINIFQSLVEAGMNLNIGRGDKDQWKSDFANDAKQHPVLSSFKNAKEMFEFGEDIYGSMEVRIGKDVDETEAVKSVPGRGYEVKYTEYRDEYKKDLHDYVNGSMDRDAFEKKHRTIIPPAELDDIRRMIPYQRIVEIDAMAQRFAIEKIRRQLIFLKQALKTGIYAPDLQLSSMKAPAEDTYRTLYYRILDDIREIGQRAYQY